MDADNLRGVLEPTAKSHYQIPGWLRARGRVNEASAVDASSTLGDDGDDARGGFNGRRLEVEPRARGAGGGSGGSGAGGAVELLLQASCRRPRSARSPGGGDVLAQAVVSAGRHAGRQRSRRLESWRTRTSPGSLGAPSRSIWMPCSARSTPTARPARARAVNSTATADIAFDGLDVLVKYSDEHLQAYVGTPSTDGLLLGDGALFWIRPSGELGCTARRFVRGRRRDHRQQRPSVSVVYARNRAPCWPSAAALS